ncbi:hypothetical protein BCR34DRAFT_589879 [Clohesyomyces aquaticus]|uniref:PAT1 multi-domain protein n=1 Tax=Clohesyomyces aquaticus TaxID=1231657 RepID=A0A1Y1ZEC0_9PLEO|nr:hypothetical protein BCR34DRAFT_589879 [Clohesyomyces aquaticus]
MSQYPGAPPAGAYVPPQGGAAYPYGGQKPPKTGGIGGYLNQAVTTGKPFLDKLGKTIGSKVSGKQSTPATPQHLAGYQQYQQHQQQQGYGQGQQSAYGQGQQTYGQGQQQTYGQALEQQQTYGQDQQQFSPQPQQQQWQQPQQQAQPQQQPQQNAYQASPNPPSNYATPASAHSGQSNYFPQQAPATPNPQQPPQPPQPQQPQQPPTPGYTPNQQFGQVQGEGAQQGQPAQGQNQPQNQPGQWQPQGQAPQGQYQQEQPQQGQQYHQQQGQYQQGQQTGVISPQPPQAHNVSPISPHATLATQNYQTHDPQQQQQQQQWAPSTPGPGVVNPAPPQPTGMHPTPSPGPQQTQGYVPTPSPGQQYGNAPPPPAHPNQQQHQQQWAPLSPTGPQGGQSLNHVSPSVSPPPQAAGNLPAVPPYVPPQQQPQPTPPPASTSTPIAEAPTEFIAELPADLGNLENSAQPQRPPSNPPQNSSPYQAYQPNQGGQAPGFTVPRRAVSMSSMPIADPWRVADAVTEQPTREFYIVADLLFDALDRKCEPQNTGMLEASKILESWKVQQMADEAVMLFQHKTFNAFAKLWILEGVPHMMVPVQLSLSPQWNFQKNDAMHLLDEPPPATSGYPVYMPAINRAGWYKYLFMEMVCEPEGLEKMLPAFCAETYKPGVLNQPDLAKRDRTEIPGLTAKVNAVRQNAVTRVVQETAAEMQKEQGVGAGGGGGGGGGALTEQEMALKMQSLKIQQQTNDMLNQTMMGGGKSFSMGAGNVYKPNYGSFV